MLWGFDYEIECSWIVQLSDLLLWGTVATIHLQAATRQSRFDTLESRNLSQDIMTTPELWLEYLESHVCT